MMWFYWHTCDPAAAQRSLLLLVLAKFVREETGWCLWLAVRQ
jgi:hypothetical protein